MTAQVIHLPRPSYEPPSRTERLLDRMAHARVWLESRTVDRSPVVIIRRRELGRREKNAFELGRECERYLR